MLRRSLGAKGRWLANKEEMEGGGLRVGHQGGSGREDGREGNHRIKAYMIADGFLRLAGRGQSNFLRLNFIREG